MSDEKPPLFILSLTVKNVKRIEVAQVTPTCQDIVIGGNNRQGKTSLLDAIELAFTGKISGKACEKPLRSGAENGGVEIDCGEFTLRRGFTAAGKTSVKVVPKGQTAGIPSPQSFIDEQIGRIGFDPSAFINQTPKEQLETLREIAGINTAMLDARYKATFDDRTEVNRRQRDAAALVPQYSDKVRGKTEPEKRVTLTELLKEHAEAVTLNAENAKKKATLATLERIAGQVEQKLEQKKEEIRLLQKQLEEQVELRVQLEEELSLGRNAIKELTPSVAALEDADVAAIQADMQNAEAINALKDAFEKMKEQQAKVLSLEEESKALTAELDDIANHKRERIAKAAYPIKGLMLGDHGVEFNGSPFSQCSDAEQLTISVAIGVAINPRVRVLLIRRGCFLDDVSLDHLCHLAKQHNVQLWIERVGDGDECEFIIDDGKISEVRTITDGD